MGGTSGLSMSAFFHMSNSPGVVVFCTIRFDYQGGTSDLGMSAFFHM